MIIFLRVFKLQSGHEYAYISIKGEITQKVFKGLLSFLYGTHCPDLFYITAKYRFHQNIQKGIQIIERTRKCLRTDVGMGRRTDRRQAHRYITRTFRSGDKKDNKKCTKDDH